MDTFWCSSLPLLRGQSPSPSHPRTRAIAFSLLSLASCEEFQMLDAASNCSFNSITRPGLRLDGDGGERRRLFLALNFVLMKPLILCLALTTKSPESVNTCASLYKDECAFEPKHTSMHISSGVFRGALGHAPLGLILDGTFNCVCKISYNQL